MMANGLAIKMKKTIFDMGVMMDKNDMCDGCGKTCHEVWIWGFYESDCLTLCDGKLFCKSCYAYHEALKNKPLILSDEKSCLH